MATIRKKRSGYQCMIRRAGFPHQSKMFKTRKLAKEWGRDIESKMDKGVFVDFTNAKFTTFGNLLRLYLSEVTENRRREESRSVETYTINRILRDEPALCSVTMDKLRPEHFEDYRDRRRNSPSPYKKRKDGSPDGIAYSTINRDLSIMKCAIDHRKRKLGLTFNPAAGQDVKRYTVNDERDFRLSEEEYKLILEICYGMRNKLVGPFLELLFETGARRSELIGVLWDDIDLEKRTALFRDVKNTRNPDKIINRGIGLSPRAIYILDKLPRTNLRPFPMTANAYKCSFQRARRKAAKIMPRIKEFRTHDARHERTTTLVAAGWSAPKVMAQTGHCDPRSLRRYTNLQASFLGEELAKL